MGVGYMIVPRFRNVHLSSVRLVYASFVLIVFSIAASIVSTFANDALSLLRSFTQFVGISIFSAITIWTLKIRPRLLRTADYFIALSIIVLLATNLLQLLSQIGRENGNPLTVVQMLLLFAILMVFGVEYKTLPSFLGFIKPRKRLSVVSFGLAVASVILG
jgi:hypothetical protein